MDEGPNPAAGTEVWIDQELCTGDGLCVQYARDVFEFDIDGLAYVKAGDGELLTAAGARTVVPRALLPDVREAARKCPGECIYLHDSGGTDAGAAG